MSAWCWCWATSRISHDSGSAECTIRSALGGANGSARAWLERAVELRALGERSEPAVELLVEAEVLHERLDAVRAHGRVQAPAAVAQRLELLLRLEPLRSEPCRSPLQHAPELDRIVDVRARELAHDEAPARQRLEQPLVLERHQGDAERCPRDAELLHEPELGNALARLEGAVEE